MAFAPVQVVLARTATKDIGTSITKPQRDAAVKQAKALGLLKGTAIWQEPATPSGQLGDSMLINPPDMSFDKLYADNDRMMVRCVFWEGGVPAHAVALVC